MSKVAPELAERPLLPAPRAVELESPLPVSESPSERPMSEKPTEKPTEKRHRGPGPQDSELFAPRMLPSLQDAVADLSWLLSRDYAERSAAKIVGDRYQLTARQRLAVLRGSCSDAARARRETKRRPLGECAGRELRIDGHNLLITLESALSGALLLTCRDGCYRDLASLHGTYRRVPETEPAILLVGELLEQSAIESVTWYLDAPVSNSGRLKLLLMDTASTQGWGWRTELAPNPDPILAKSPSLIASHDSWILDHCGGWIDLARETVEEKVPEAWVVTLAGSSPTA